MCWCVVWSHCCIAAAARLLMFRCCCLLGLSGVPAVQAFESPRAFAMSKFFAGGDSSTESSESESSSSGSGSESESEDEKPQQKIKQQKEQPKERAGPRKVVSKNVKTHQDFKPRLTS